MNLTLVLSNPSRNINPLHHTTARTFSTWAPLKWHGQIFIPNDTTWEKNLTSVLSDPSRNIDPLDTASDVTQPLALSPLRLEEWSVMPPTPRKSESKFLRMPFFLCSGGSSPESRRNSAEVKMVHGDNIVTISFGVPL